MLEDLTLESFAPHVGTEFRLAGVGPTPVALTLVEATPLGPDRPRADGPARAPFSLIFRGPRTPAFPQRIYQLEHDRLSTLEIFLVPIGPDRDGLRYEAIFN